VKHIWSIFCRNLLEDRSSNNPSLIDVTEHIGFRGELPDTRPIVLPFPFPLFIVSNWWRDSEEDKDTHPCRVRFVSPDGEELRKMEFNVNLEKVTSMRTYGQISELPYTVNGIYEFEVAYRENEEWEVVARIPLEIVNEQPETEQLEREPVD